MNQQMTRDEVTNYLLTTFKEAGFHIMFYASPRGSRYIKLDYGVSKTIRIADHKEKAHLGYRYNVIKDTVQRYDKRTKRFYYGWNTKDTFRLVQQIIKDRNDKLERYGIEKYQLYMEQNLNDKRFTEGFWSDAREY